VGVIKSATEREDIHHAITTIGIDLAKTVFQLHAVDADGATVNRKRLRRAEVLSFVSGLEPCLIGMEACARSHYRARELAKFGHTNAQ
jgi:transposase